MKKSSFNLVYVLLISFLYIITGITLETFAQSPPGWAWAKRIGDFSNQTGEENHGRGIGTDMAGNVYMLGEFTGTIVLDGLSAVSAGETDIFLAKYSATGSLIWLRRIGSASIETATNLVVDSTGNCTLTGTYGVIGGNDLILPNGQVLVGPANAGLPPDGGTRYGRFAFGVSFDALGDVRWATRFTPSYNLIPSHLALDGQGNAYVSGTVRGSVLIAGQTYPILGINDGFLMKLSGAGQIQWFRQAGATGVDCTGGQVATDNANAIYWSYSANQPIQIGNVAGYASTATNGTPIVKFSVANRLLWIRSLATTNTVGGISMVGIDQSTNTIMAHGAVWNGAVVSFTNYSSPITGPTGNDIGSILAIADTSGSVTWARQVATSPRNSFSFASSIVSAVRNGRQDIVTTFIMAPNSPVTISNYGAITTPQSGMLIMEYIPSSNTVRSARLANMTADSYGNHAGTVVDTQNNILMGGSFMGTARFGVTTLTSTISTRRDAFFAKLDQTVLSNHKATITKKWSLYPNPADRLVTVNGFPNTIRLRLSDAQGRTVRMFEAMHAISPRSLLLDGLAPGLYLLSPDTPQALYMPQKLIIR